jgi:hypothetical protein
MTSNFKQLDAVFAKDCSICSANLKRMWCDYTCGVNKADYVNGTGYIFDNSTGENYTMTTFTMNPDYACTLFQACAKVSFIS